MLPRVLEAEVMDTEAEARDYDAMDFAEVNRAFVEDFWRYWDVCSPVLDVCTGTARIPIELCRYFAESDAATGGDIVKRWGQVRVVGVDLADHMHALARRNVEAAGMGDRITLVKGDAKQLPFTDGSFRAVMGNGSVHHVPDPFVCFAEMHRVCDPHGVIFVRDLLRPPDVAALQAILNRHAAGANDHQRAMFAASLRASLTLEEVRDLVGRLGYVPESVQQTSNRHWTWAATRP